MGLFSRHTSARGDMRDRDYVLTGYPVVAQDGLVLVVDATVRLTVRPPTDGFPAWGYNPTEEDALHAVFVLALRLMASRVPSDELLTGRALVAEALEEGHALAPVGARVQARVLSAVVHPHDPAKMTMEHEFRVVDA